MIALRCVCESRNDGITDCSMFLLLSCPRSANFVAVGGALLAPWLCDGLGRRKTFSVSCVVFIVGVSFVVLAPSMVSNNGDAYGLMMAGRILTVSTSPSMLSFNFILE